MNTIKKIKHHASSTLFGFNLFLYAFFLCIPSKVVLAEEPFSFSPYIDLSSQGLSNKSWLSPIAVPNNDNELWLIDSTGKLYQSEGQNIEITPIFDFAKNVNNHKPLYFSAITLHPNFSLLDQVGSKTLYTAHIEVLNPLVQRDIVQSNDINKPYTHDAVVIEWHLDTSKGTELKLIKAREVIRVATASADIKINQLAFNSQLKSWDDNFGLLFAGLDYD